MALLSSCPAVDHHEFELSQITTYIAQTVEGLTYKPYPDGGGNWVFSLDIDNEVIVSIWQMDGRVDMSLAAMFLALFLKGFEERIANNILSGLHPARREIEISIGSRAEMPSDLQDFVELPLTESVCAVTRASEVTDDRTPTFVCCREDIGDDWGTGAGEGGNLQVLLAHTALEIVYSLLHGEVDRKTLEPKIVSVVRETVS